MKKVTALLILTCLFFLSAPSPSLGAMTMPAFERSIEQSIGNVKDSQQLIIVEGQQKNFRAVYRTYEFTNGKWVKKSVSPAVVGKNGISPYKIEGDGASPQGLFAIGESFGYGAKPANLKVKYTRTNHYHYWVDDVQSPDYNKWVYYKGNPYTRWKSFERLNHPLYKHALIIRYNERPIKGKGSAIFIHRWRYSTVPTAGCVALSEPDLVKTLQWIDPYKNPKIIMGDQTSILNKLNTYPTK
ncbi:L,D-peptidoglycan transpeptidase YkuD (ErfK/YbiS/YcfS/YnhG family) [Bacillus ectoiniformans]|uniref:L,D-transpeptidase family protein n=1 Tax=Bacillus ectoiniformans TaxID=1494429 RepID=UPI001EF8BC8B|nr:L,D-transpeptidase family protein [Bacillus ectoiniformans]MBM7650130.1 L,D-peptidoglycan transpeptidase YkuD (ErfK/YbiS/YcfS/YnhG family) [Bacillus ectoiniformans]